MLTDGLSYTWLFLLLMTCSLGRIGQHWAILKKKKLKSYSLYTIMSSFAHQTRTSAINLTFCSLYYSFGTCDDFTSQVQKYLNH